MSVVTLDKVTLKNVLLDGGRDGLASRIQNQSHLFMNVWFNSGAAPDPAVTKPDLIIPPWDDRAVDGTQKVWCRTGQETNVSVTAQIYS